MKSLILDYVNYFLWSYKNLPLIRTSLGRFGIFGVVIAVCIGSF